MATRDGTPKDNEGLIDLIEEEEIAALQAEGFFVLKPISLPDIEVDAPEFGDSPEDEILKSFFRSGTNQIRAQKLLELEIEALGFKAEHARFGPYKIHEAAQETADPSAPQYGIALYVHRDVHPDFQFVNRIFEGETREQ